MSLFEVVWELLISVSKENEDVISKRYQRGHCSYQVSSSCPVERVLGHFVLRRSDHIASFYPS